MPLPLTGYLADLHQSEDSIAGIGDVVDMSVIPSPLFSDSIRPQGREDRLLGWG